MHTHLCTVTYSIIFFPSYPGHSHDHLSSCQPHQSIIKPEKRAIENAENKLVSTSVSPPWLSSLLMPEPEGPMPLPIPPNTPGVVLYGVVPVPVVVVVVPVPVPVVDGVVPVEVPMDGAFVTGVVLVPAALVRKRYQKSHHTCISL